MRSISALILMLTFSVTAIAKPYTLTQTTPAQVMEKYDYLLTAHPQAHEANFQAENLRNYKAELSASLSHSTIDEVRASFNNIINKIPQTAKREAYVALLNNSTKEELLKYFSSPALMNTALAGESANFSLITDEPLIAVTYIVLTGLILYAVINAILKSNRPKFSSYAVTIEDVEFCADYTFNQYVTTSEKNNMKADAKMRCESESDRPDTCKFFGFLYNFQRYTYTTQDGDTVEGQKGSCTGVASYRSKKK